MASHHRPKSSNRARIGALAVAAATVVALSASGGAQADPGPTAEEVRERIEELRHEAAVVTEEFNGATEQQDRLQREVNELQDDVARGQAELTRMQSTLGAVASAQYRSGGVDPSLRLMLSGDPEEYLAKAAALDQLSAEQAESLEEVSAHKRALDQRRAEAAAKLQELETVRTTAVEKKEEIQEKLREQQELLERLTAEERAALAEEERRAAEEAAGRASRDDVRGALDAAAASGHAAAAVAAAQSALGLPYVWGAEGPSSFDCSGLTSWAWARAGVTIPRTSQGQLGAGTPVSLSEALPGDLVIFYGDASHVGMYVGGGVMIHAPYTGAVVRYESVDTMPVHSVIRV
ncbi:C40 family peptidase [Allostreptomyces psammosilenae]|uniref:Cell wall-associated NlpC family hydrolase n=1 Tax=Allostreptomyces psammosilenae TaxID=1892865 RepID=A0A852ZYZ0_9ACTN|nr:NlpC/P60 family protein [Allostreptomyces psammosilenae]NYI07037.1 cell wall-associated NlpC family hydrolase [Allostreptomyces psammosilenae]